MMYYFIILAAVFLVGLAVGSFLNVVIYRTLHEESPFGGRSKCDSCQRKIRAIDNIPLLSFLILRGRCRYCKKRISLSYPVVELLTGVLFVWWFFAGYSVFQLTQSPFSSIQKFFWLLVGLIFIALIFSDFLYGVLPDILVGILTLLAFGYRFLLFLGGIMQPQDFWRSILSALGAFGFFFLLIFITRGRGMGMGDAKLSFALGLILGWPRILVSLFLSFVLGGAVSAFLLLTGKKRFGQTIPFGPYLISGAAIALVWGSEIWQRYIGFLI